MTHKKAQPPTVSVWKFLATNTAVPTFANAAALFWLLEFLPFIYPERILLESQEFSKHPLYALSNLSPFPIIAIFTFIYVWPLFMHFYRESDYREATELVKRRILSMPISFGFLTILGWVLGTTSTSFLYWYITPNAKFEFVLYLIGMSIAVGSLAFVLTYYTLDYFNRKWFLPAIFPKGGISKVQGRIRMHIIKKFFLFFYAISVFPTLIWFVVSERILSDPASLPEGTQVDLILLLIVFAFLSFWITALLGLNIIRPTRAMSQMAKQISEGDLNVFVPVVSNDEIGQLGEHLNEMVAGLREKEALKDTFGRLVDPKVRDHLLHEGLQLGGETLEASILFVDIRDFTSMSERLNPKQVVNLLNRYFDVMSTCVTEAGGIVNKYIGDAILAIFGAPLPSDLHATQAVDAALRMRRELLRLNRDFDARDMEPIRIGIGIHTGPVLSGNIGSASRLEYTVIGDSVNIASRLEGATKKVGSDLLISGSVRAALDLEELRKNWRELDFISKGRIRVKGKSEPIPIYVPV